MNYKNFITTDIILMIIVLLNVFHDILKYNKLNLFYIVIIIILTIMITIKTVLFIHNDK